MKMTRGAWRKIARQAQDLAKAGRIIDAIKHLRAMTGCGLKEAHDAAYALRKIPDITGEGAEYGD